MFQAHQGDVYIRQISAIPIDTKKVDAKGDIILAHGETTGHAHRIGSHFGAVMFMAAEGGGGSFLQVNGGASLTHEEHATINLPAGLYEVTIQSQYAPEAIRNVAD